jgi:pimeloyl-ACP methyl ester carboxylesterase
MAGSEKRFIEIGGIRTCYVEAGSGPTVLLLHSADAGSSGALEYRLNIGPLSREFRVIAPDLLGFGNTELPKPGIPDINDAYIEHVLGFMDALHIERAHLVGNSRGGLISIPIAHTHPARVASIILLANAGGGVTQEYLKKMTALYAGFTPTRENVRFFLSGSYADVDRHVSPDVLDLYVENAVRQYAGYDRFGPLPGAVPDVRGPLEKIQTPVFFMMGKNDQRWPPAHDGLDVYLKTPNSRYLSLNCGHHPQTELPEYFNMLAPAFLRGELR